MQIHTIQTLRPSRFTCLDASTLPEAFSDEIAPVQEDTAISFGTETAVTRGLNYSSVTSEIKSTRQKWEETRQTPKTKFASKG